MSDNQDTFTSTEIEQMTQSGELTLFMVGASVPWDGERNGEEIDVSIILVWHAANLGEGREIFSFLVTDKDVTKEVHHAFSRMVSGTKSYRVHIAGMKQGEGLGKVLELFNRGFNSKDRDDDPLSFPLIAPMSTSSGMIKVKLGEYPARGSFGDPSSLQSVFCEGEDWYVVLTEVDNTKPLFATKLRHMPKGQPNV